MGAPARALRRKRDPATAAERAHGDGHQLLSEPSWTASTDPIGVTGYNILRDGVQIGTSTTTSYTDNSVASNTAYTYTVIAYDAAGIVSTPSNSASATTPRGAVPVQYLAGRDADRLF